MTVDFNNRGGVLKKPGLGDLFAVYSNDTSAAYKNLLQGSMLWVPGLQAKLGEYNSNIFCTEALAPLIRNTSGKMVNRFNDMIPGFPYQWTTLGEWLRLVDSATRRVSTMYKDVTLCIAPFNEPDKKMQGAFLTDPTVMGSSYDEKINWVWTQTVNKIKSIDAAIPIMGPNYEDYYPWENGGILQQKMKNFLLNAMATNTVPDIVGWHKLRPSPGDVPYALTFFRQLENEVNLPGRPKSIMVEEFGNAQGAFEGVPGGWLKDAAELERSHVDYGAMGIYTTAGSLGNTIRYAYDNNPQPNAGWYTMNWYKTMQGMYVPVSRWDTRYYQAFDGVASYNAATQTATVVFGGSNDNADIILLGIGSLLGSQVRVRLDCAYWDVYPFEKNARVENGGDAKQATLNIFDKTFTADASGNIMVPVHRLEMHHGYRLLISTAAATSPYPDKYETEAATVVSATVKTATLHTSDRYVSDINSNNSYVEFDVNVAVAGIYLLTARYSATAIATHVITVDGLAQGSIAYDSITTGFSNTELRFATKRVKLKAGPNKIRMAKGIGVAELDFIYVMPDTHRYEAEFADYQASRKGYYANLYVDANYIGSIDNTNSYVEFTVDAPAGGNYNFEVAYADGLTTSATHTVTVNGISTGVINYDITGGWLDKVDENKTVRKVKSIQVNLTEGLNKVRLTKGDGFAELDYARLTSVNVVMGINQLQAIDSFHIYPNPASSKIYLKGSFTGTTSLILKFFSVDGNEVYHTKLTPPFSSPVNLPKFLNGLYFIQVFSKQKLISKSKLLITQ